jgi:sterol desaturase/sphingolipid hydroxylase (fatty acid hydroxylase superfamily)
VSAVLPLLRAGISSLLLLAAVFVPLERAFPARPGQRVFRPGLALDACFFFGQYLLWNVISIAILTAVERLFAVHGLTSLRSWVATWPAFSQAIVAVILGDLLVYWFHRACHALPPLWRIHAVHHSSEELDFLAAHREHPLDGIATQLCANLPAFVLGFDVSALAGLITFRSMWAIFVHSNVRLPLGWLRWVLGAPELHHWHHARSGPAHNFANVAPFLDLIFGTHHCPERTEAEDPFPLGLAEPLPARYGALLASPFSALARACHLDLSLGLLVDRWRSSISSSRPESVHSSANSRSTPSCASSSSATFPTSPS